MTTNNTFRAPQKQLKSSFPHTPFTKPKGGVKVIKRSLSRKATPIIKYRGNMTGISSTNSNIY